MIKYSRIIFTLAGITIALFRCDSGTQTVQVQDIAELKWQADGNAMFGFMQTYTETATSSLPGIGYTIVKFGTDGSLAQTFTVDPKSRIDFSSSLYISDNNTIVTQLENDLYRFNTKTGVLEKLQQQFHLIVVSSDLRFAVGSPSPASQPIKTIQVFDLSVSPIRLVTHFDVKALANSCGVWLNNGSFGVTVNEPDSVGTHISIYDTTSTGTPLLIVGGAEIQFHNFVFNPQSNDLFIRNHAGKLTDYFVDKVNLTTNIRTTILRFKVENFDLTKDEQTIIYSAYDSTSSISMKSRNLASQHENLIATDIRLIISLSPSEDKLAYIRKRNDNFSEVRVIPFTKP